VGIDRFVVSIGHVDLRGGKGTFRRRQHRPRAWIAGLRWRLRICLDRPPALSDARSVLLRTPSTPDHRAALAGVDCVGGAWVVLDGLAAASIQNLESLENRGGGGKRGHSGPVLSRSDHLVGSVVPGFSVPVVNTWPSFCAHVLWRRGYVESLARCLGGSAVGLCDIHSRSNRVIVACLSARRWRGKIAERVGAHRRRVSGWSAVNCHTLQFCQLGWANMGEFT